MFIAAFALLSSAALVGTLILSPRRMILAHLKRRTAAATHGILGGAGLAVLVFAASREAASQMTWLAAALLGAGLIGGITIFATCRHLRAAPALLLALHIVFAGMGYLLFVGLILS